MVGWPCWDNIRESCLPVHLKLRSSQVEEIHLNYTRFLDKDTRSIGCRILHRFLCFLSFAGGRDPLELHPLPGQGQRPGVVAQPRATRHTLHQSLRLGWVLAASVVIGSHAADCGNPMYEPQALALPIAPRAAPISHPPAEVMYGSFHLLPVAVHCITHCIPFITSSLMPSLPFAEVMEDSFHLLLDLAQAAQRPDLLRTVRPGVAAGCLFTCYCWVLLAPGGWCMESSAPTCCAR